MSDVERQQIEALHRRRPRDRFLRGSFLVLIAVMLGAWFVGDSLFEGSPFSARRSDNVARFLGELLPYPVQQGEGWWAAAAWARELLMGDGFQGAANTIAVAVAAIAFAGFFALLLAPVGSRTAMPGQLRPGAARRVAETAMRSVFLLSRAIPEYILAFLLVALLGPHPWALVLALAVHNFGILGRLGSETLEDVPRSRPAFLAASGLPRWAVFLTGLLPATLTRMFVYFFYRWETCIRDATVLGMLGFATFGYFITEARARLRYDEMAFFVLLSIAIVAAGDALSRAVRRAVR